MSQPHSKTCFQAASLNGLNLKNRFIKAGTFENLTPGGVPGPELLAFHQAFAEGGVAMTTLGYCAVENAGRINENMLYMHEGIRQPLAHIIDSLHDKGTKVSGQMGHCGGFSANRTLERRPRGPSFGLNLLGVPEGMLFCDAMSQQDIDALVEAYGRAAQFMKSAGFDAVEIHFGHGYGLCQFMSPKTNRRRDNYGGSLANRMRLPLRVLAAVREAVGDDFPILGKISLSEGSRGGLELKDSLQAGQMLDQAGIDAIIPSIGTSTMNPMLMFRGKSILPALLASEPSLAMRLIYRLVGPVMFKAYPFEEAYLLAQASLLRERVGCALVYIGGACSNQSFARIMDAGFDFIQLGRGLLADPDLVIKAESQLDFKSRCTHCNACVGTINSKQGVHCPVFQSAGDAA